MKYPLRFVTCRRFGRRSETETSGDGLHVPSSFHTSTTHTHTHTQIISRSHSSVRTLNPLQPLSYKPYAEDVDNLSRSVRWTT